MTQARVARARENEPRACDERAVAATHTHARACTYIHAALQKASYPRLFAIASEPLNRFAWNFTTKKGRRARTDARKLRGTRNQWKSFISTRAYYEINFHYNGILISIIRLYICDTFASRVRHTVYIRKTRGTEISSFSWKRSYRRPFKCNFNVYHDFFF